METLLLPLQPSLHSISLSAFVLVLIFLLQKWLLSSSQTSPPSPPKLPIFGHLLNLGSHPHLTLHNYARRHGPLFLLRLGSVPTIVVSSADLARDIMKTHDLVFATRPKSSIRHKLLYNSRDIVASPYGEYWRQMKSIGVLHLLSNKRVQSFRSIREEEVKLMIENIQQNPVSVNLTEIFSGLTQDVICRVGLGRKYGVGEDGMDFRGLLMEFGQLLGSFCIRDFIPWLGWIDGISGLDSKANRVVKELDDFFDRVIKDHINPDKNFDEHKDLVDVLLWTQRENSIGFPLEMDSIKALILDMFATRTDTTYTLMEWAMSELLKHPKMMKKLKEEIREIKDNDRECYVNEDDLNKMVYLKAVIKETLRLHPPIPLLVPRESTQHIKLRGYDIKPKTRIMINAWTIERDPKLWEEADVFQPERFMKNTIDFKGQDFELIPFGAGRRGCPGIVFATIINEIALANLVHKFEWILANGEDLDMTKAFGLPVRRKFPLVATTIPC